MTAKRVLLIEDEEIVREATQMCLEIVAGWEILPASSGREGLAQAEAQQPDAILLDVMMPDMDGVTTLSKLQANPKTKQIPVIFLTAKVQSAEQRQLAQLGVKAVISKPYDPMTLVEKISQALGWEM